MKTFCSRLARDRTIAIWGMGYLGYTEALRAQTLGFTPVLWDYIPDRLRQLQDKSYLDPSLCAAWSLAQDLPTLDMDKVLLAEDVATAATAPLHLICLPAEEHTFFNHIYSVMRDVLLTRKDALLIFLSATSPGFIDSIFAAKGEGAAHCGMATAFRQDWYFEEMLTDQSPRPVGTNDARSRDMVIQLFEILQQPMVWVGSIKAAEIMAHARPLLQDMNSTFVNQLALAFPDTDIRRMTPLLFKGLTPRLQAPSLGQVDIRQVTALRHLAGSQGNIERLSLAPETQRASLSLLLTYADILLAHKIKKVLILGLSPLLAAQRDPRISPSLILADYLHQHGVSVIVHDPSYDAESLAQLLPYAQPWCLNTKICCDAVLAMRDIPTCRALTQKALEDMGITGARIIFDNVGMFRFNAFPQGCMHHVPGDGKLHLLAN